MKTKIFKKGKLLAGAVLAAGIGLGSVIGAVTFAENAEAATRNAWVYDKNKGGYVYYGSDGKIYKGWHYMTSKEKETTPHWSYFGKDGKIYTNWQYMDAGEGETTSHWSYFGPNGWLRTGWQQLGKGTGNPDGNSSKHWSYFGPNGWLRTGWQELGKGTSNPDGNAARHRSYFGSNGWLRTGTQKIDGKTYNFDPSGWLVNSPDPQNVIGTSKAKSIALSHAGLSADRIYGYKCELDWENGVYVYEIDFKSGRYEYEYDINAYTGTIIKYNREYDD